MSKEITVDDLEVGQTYQTTADWPYEPLKNTIVQIASFESTGSNSIVHLVTQEGERSTLSIEKIPDRIKLGLIKRYWTRQDLEIGDQVILPTGKVLRIDSIDSRRVYWNLKSQNSIDFTLAQLNDGQWKLIKAGKEEEETVEMSNEKTTIKTEEKTYMKSTLGMVAAGAGSAVTVDILVKAMTRKLAKLLIASGKPEMAEALISKEGRQIAKTIAPLTLLGVAYVCAKSENDALAGTAKQLIGPLEAAATVGVSGLASTAIESWLLDETDEIDDIRSMIKAAKTVPALNSGQMPIGETVSVKSL